MFKDSSCNSSKNCKERLTKKSKKRNRSFLSFTEKVFTKLNFLYSETFRYRSFLFLCYVYIRQAFPFLTTMGFHMNNIDSIGHR